MNLSMESQRVGHDLVTERQPQCSYFTQLVIYLASLLAQTVKNLPSVQEIWVWFLGWKGPLEKPMATHFSIVAWRIPWTEEPDGVQSMGLQRVGHDWSDLAHMHTCELVHICELVVLHSILLFHKKMHSKDSFVQLFLTYGHKICFVLCWSYMIPNNRFNYFKKINRLI